MRVLHVVSVINLVIIGVLSQKCGSGTRFTDVYLWQKLENEGFHRTLTYDIEFPVNRGRDVKFYNGCNITLRQNLPPGVYADEDELQELCYMKEIRAGVYKMYNLNTEVPAEEAYPMEIYVIGRIVDSKARLWVPLHARYHSAKPATECEPDMKVCGMIHASESEEICEPKSGFARNTIRKPDVFIGCPDDRANTDYAALCGEDSEMVEIQKIANMSQLMYRKLTGTVYWDVPIGNTNYYNLVATVTLLAVILGSVWLLLSIHEYKIKQKKNDAQKKEKNDSQKEEKDDAQKKED